MEEKVETPKVEVPKADPPKSPDTPKSPDAPDSPKTPEAKTEVPKEPTEKDLFGEDDD